LGTIDTRNVPKFGVDPLAWVVDEELELPPPQAAAMMATAAIATATRVRRIIIFYLSIAVMYLSAKALVPMTVRL
jgi:hypothetical protein